MHYEYRQSGVFDARSEWTSATIAFCVAVSAASTKKEQRGRVDERREEEKSGKGQQQSTWQRFRHRDCAALYLVTMDEKHGFAQLAYSPFLDLLYCRG